MPNGVVSLLLRSTRFANEEVHGQPMRIAGFAALQLAVDKAITQVCMVTPWAHAAYTHPFVHPAWQPCNVWQVFPMWLTGVCTRASCSLLCWRPSNFAEFTGRSRACEWTAPEQCYSACDVSHGLGEVDLCEGSSPIMWHSHLTRVYRWSLPTTGASYLPLQRNTWRTAGSTGARLRLCSAALLLHPQVCKCSVTSLCSCCSQAITSFPFPDFLVTLAGSFLNSNIDNYISTITFFPRLSFIVLIMQYAAAMHTERVSGARSALRKMVRVALSLPLIPLLPLPPFPHSSPMQLLWGKAC